VDDLRQYAFPPLPTGPILGNRTVRAQYVPTDEMQEAMDELVDQMDLSAEEGSNTAELSFIFRLAHSWSMYL
jgi:hypothetical protein